MRCMPCELRGAMGARGAPERSEPARTGNPVTWVEGAPRYYLQSYRDSEQVYRREFTPPSLEELHTYEAILAPHVGEVALRGVDD